ncbi:M protein [Streptococcus pyogenes]|uniref:M protein n=6 Tax=Streptococcus pyogenes TaxID=1314 RepID=UPI0010A0FFA4|nr:M protein [Streptococcus pyogenes]VGW15608.1 M protein [Streptococcus pyogenes]
MTKNNTNRRYSLRKLKTGTASVAVALTVVGAGLVAGQTVRADDLNFQDKHEIERLEDLKSKFQKLKTYSERHFQEAMQAAEDYYDSTSNSDWYIGYLKTLNDDLEQAYNELSGDGVKKLAASLMEDKVVLKEKIEKIKTMSETLKQKLEQKEKELENKKAERDLEHAAYARDRKEHEEYVRRVGLLLEDRAKEKEELQSLVEQAKKKIDSLNQELAQKEEELAKEKLAKQGIIDSTSDYVREKESEIAKLKEEIQSNGAQLESLNNKLAEQTSEIDNLKQELTRRENMYESFLNQAKENLASKEQELAKLKQLETINNNLLGNAKDMIAKLSAKNEQLASDKAKLEEQNKISDASRQGLRRDLNASREAKKQVEKDLANLTAELDKVKEDKQISDASRQGLRRDLNASREAKKQVEKALEEANSKLAALEKLNKELEESKKLTEKEKAELQAKLEAEAKALKEQLAKQAEELAKLRAGKASDSQTPDTKPGNKAVPGKGQAPQAGTKPNQNKAPMKETKRQLPSTGETANPFFTAAALTVMATAGVAAVVKRKEEN